MCVCVCVCVLCVCVCVLCMCVCMCVLCMCAYVHVCVHVCVRVLCMCACVHVCVVSMLLRPTNQMSVVAVAAALLSLFNTSHTRSLTTTVTHVPYATGTRHITPLHTLMPKHTDVFPFTHLGGDVLKPNRVADFIAQSDIHLLTHALGDRHGCHSSGLRTAHHPIVSVAVFMEILPGMEGEGE